MKKFIMLAFIICFVGSASAAEVTYYFTAEIYDFTDDAGLLSEMGYSAGMPLKGTITIDPEIGGMTDGDPYGPNGWGLWTTGIIMFENQGYDWLDSCTRHLFIQNNSTGHEIRILTKQGYPTTNPDDPEMIQQIVLTVDGLDASMPNDLDLGNSPQYIFQLTKAGEPKPYSFAANIIEIMNEEEYANRTAKKEEAEPTPVQIIGDMCPCDDNSKNHGAYVSCIAKTAKEFAKAGLITKKEKSDLVSAAAKSGCGKNKDKKGKKEKKGKK